MNVYKILGNLMILLSVFIVIISFGHAYMSINPTVVCATLYDPVCGVDGVTYSNDCVAGVAGIEIDYSGICISSSEPRIDCQIVWYYDDEHQYCQQGEFCGAYMYEGLHTFSTLEECEIEMPPIPDDTVVDSIVDLICDSDGLFGVISYSATLVFVLLFTGGIVLKRKE